MLRRALLALLLVLAPALAQAQSRGTPSFQSLNLTGSGSTGDVSGMSIPQVGSVSATLSQILAGTAVPVTAYMQAGDTLSNVAPAVARAVAAGNKILRLPANSTYIPLSNTTPADVTLIGAPDRSSIVSVANRATDLLAIGARSSLRDVGIISSFCDANTQPQGTAKVCTVGQVDNVSDTTFAAQNWVGTRMFVNSGPNYTGPTGVVSQDLPSIQVIANGAGTDATYFASNASGASATRLVTTAAGALGAQIFNGQGCPTCSGTYGMLINEYGDGSNSQKSLAFSRIGGATSIYADDYASTDTGATAHQNPFLQVALSHQGGGNLMDFYQGGSGAVGFSGTFLHINAGAAGAGWTGNYIGLDRNGTRVFQVDANGSIYSASSLTATGLAISGVVGFNGATPVGKCTLSAALPADGTATNAAMATAINAVRSCLVSNGLGQ